MYGNERYKISAFYLLPGNREKSLIPCGAVRIKEASHSAGEIYKPAERRREGERKEAIKLSCSDGVAVGGKAVVVGRDEGARGTGSEGRRAAILGHLPPPQGETRRRAQVGRRGTVVAKGSARAASGNIDTETAQSRGDVGGALCSTVFIPSLRLSLPPSLPPSFVNRLSTL